jgi:hypothetical protein
MAQAAANVMLANVRLLADVGRPENVRRLSEVTQPADVRLLA